MPRGSTGAAILAFALLAAGCLASPRADPGGPAPAHPAVADAAGDAPAFLDVLAARFVEDARTLAVEIDVARFDEATIARTLREHGAAAAWVFACWRQGNATPPQWVRAAASVDKVVAPDTECAGVEVFAAETMPVIGQYISYHGPDDGCNSWWFCAWRLPHEVRAGSPATLRIAIPRELLYDARRGALLEDPHLESGVWHWDPGSPSGATGWGARACPSVAGAGLECLRAGQRDQNEILDTSEVGQGYALQLASAPDGASWSDGEVLIHDGIGDVAADLYSPDIDVLEVRLEETGDEMAYVTRVAGLDERPWHGFSMFLGIAGTVYYAGYGVVGGVVERVDGGWCVGDWECRQLQPRVAFAPGSPGSIRVAFACDEMNAPRKGDRVDWAELWMADRQAGRSLAAPAPVPETGVDMRSRFVIDPVFPGEPYRLRAGCPAP